MESLHSCRRATDLITQSKPYGFCYGRGDQRLVPALASVTWLRYHRGQRARSFPPEASGGGMCYAWSQTSARDVLHHLQPSRPCPGQVSLDRGLLREHNRHRPRMLYTHAKGYRGLQLTVQRPGIHSARECRATRAVTRVRYGSVRPSPRGRPTGPALGARHRSRPSIGRPEME
jgi:hypothetical protein